MLVAIQIFDTVAQADSGWIVAGRCLVEPPSFVNFPAAIFLEEFAAHLLCWPRSGAADGVVTVTPLVDNPKLVTVTNYAVEHFASFRPSAPCCDCVGVECYATGAGFAVGAEMNVRGTQYWYETVSDRETSASEGRVTHLCVEVAVGHGQPVMIGCEFADDACVNVFAACGEYPVASALTDPEFGVV